MALFGGKQKGVTYTLIDIDSSSIGGALLHCDLNENPNLHYTTRQLITLHEGEEALSAMLRTLEECARELVEKGGPILRRETGSGHSDKILVRVGAPRQETTIRKERVEDSNKPFIFTRAIMHDVLRKAAGIPKDEIGSEESVVATLLNGYDTPEPFGKQAKFAELIILSSSLKKEVSEGVQRTLRAVYHTHALSITAFASVSYAVFRRLFPHEKNFLILKVSGDATEMIFIKNSTLVKVAALDQGVNTILQRAHIQAVKKESTSSPLTSNPFDPAQNLRFSKSVEEAESAWIKTMENLFRDFADEQALPRTIFLISSDDSRDYLTRLLEDDSLKSLWLSDEPLRVIGLTANILASYLSFGAEASPDIALALLALFAAYDA